AATTSGGGAAATTSGGGTKPGAAATTSGGGGAPVASASTIANRPIFGGTGACTPATGSPIQFGNVSTLSGVLGQLFSPVVPALQIWVKSQNACGGIAGHKISLVIGDDQGDPSTARSVANRQIANDKVLAFVGNIQVLTIDAMVSLVQKAGIPMIGGDITNNTWFTHDFIFPQGPPPQAIGFAYNKIAKETFKKTKVASVYCAEVPQACSQIDKAFVELAPSQGTKMLQSTRISITAPSYQSQCTQLQKSGAEVVALTFDAAAQVRFANDCDKVGYKPDYLSYPLGVGNEKQYLGNPSLGDAIVPLNAFGWMANATPAEKYWQASVKKYNPGFTNGNAASLGWLAGALTVAASGKVTDKPTAAQLFEGLYAIKGNNLGGMAAPLTFNKGSNPKIPYCLFTVQANANNSAWKTPTSKAECSTVRAPSDPNK
ncbi:MAG: transporter substrate-binding protein, partial [Frankiales bacterium]|nr:transporter substrate-binding protein [Frankiales bacterium]